MYQNRALFLGTKVQAAIVLNEEVYKETTNQKLKFAGGLSPFSFPEGTTKPN